MTDWDGTQYGVVGELQRVMADESLRLLDLDGDEKVLDIGCGDGFVTAQIADRLPHGSIVGIDPSPRMIEAARRRDTTATFDAGNVMTVDASGEFDVVTSFNALHWVHDQATAMRNIAAALRPDGRSLLVFVCAGPRRSLEDVAMDVTAEPRWVDEFRDFRAPFVHPVPAEFAALVTAAGLEVTDQTVADKSWDFGSREAFRDWCAVGFGDWTGRLSPADADAFVDDVVDRYTDLIGSPGTFAFYQLRMNLRRAR
ncbi:class I SAM-dependent methyltransferase [Gordonia sp. OPL2]|uniref:class I SAM-dependent methyltransferase n=1 Tax=Gordonia sp. OPL2 TaxID=2486274 RepID=UPI0016553CF8|nr:class I SAM-dependent methyltransferase [Gordonia sp. OPL2]ROZ93797.1 class I SAM-dependent methyltransferase [Gordonia sp. OPL2]